MNTQFQYKDIIQLNNYNRFCVDKYILDYGKCIVRNSHITVCFPVAIYAQCVIPRSIVDEVVKLKAKESDIVQLCVSGNEMRMVVGNREWKWEDIKVNPWETVLLAPDNSSLLGVQSLQEALCRDFTVNDVLAVQFKNKKVIIKHNQSVIYCMKDDIYPYAEREMIAVNAQALRDAVELLRCDKGWLGWWNSGNSVMVYDRRHICIIQS